MTTIVSHCDTGLTTRTGGNHGCFIGTPAPGTADGRELVRVSYSGHSTQHTYQDVNIPMLGQQDIGKCSTITHLVS